MSEPGTRRFARVAERVPVRWRELAPGAAAALEREILGTPARTGAEPPGEPSDPDRAWERAALVAILARLERLEAAVAALSRAREPGPAWTAGATCCLSGGGLALEAAALPPGTLLELEISLPDEARPPIRATGRVVGPTAERDGGGAGAGVAFTAIREADREAIVRFTFRSQRAHLRERREHAGRGRGPGSAAGS